MRRLSKLLLILTMLMLVSIPGFMPDIRVRAQTGDPVQLEWGALFYPNPDFNDPLWLVTFPGNLSYNWGAFPPSDPVTGFPLAGLPADNFSVRFSTNTVFNAGTYEFTVVADGGVRLTINENVIIDELSNTGARNFSGTAFLGSGTNVIILDYVDYSGDAIIELTWIDTLDAGTDTTIDVTSAEEDNRVTAVVSGVDGLSLRTGPYLGASLVAVLRPGTTYTVTAQNNIEGTYPWYRIVTNPAGQTGWASGRFLDVDLREVIQRQCSVPINGGLSIAQTFVPGYADRNTADQCISSVANIVSQSVGGNYTLEELGNVGLQCSSFLPLGSDLQAKIQLVDRALIVFQVYDVCLNGSCNIDSQVALQIASAIASDLGISYAGTGLEALVCFNSLADLFDGTVSTQSISGLTVTCGTLMANVTAPGILSFLDAIGALICVDSSVSTLAVPEQATVFDNLTTLPDTGVTIAPRTVMNIRVRPSTRVAIVGSVPWGAEAQLLARTVEAGTDHWYLIRYDGIIGWVDASYVNVRGNINDVPIY